MVQRVLPPLSLQGEPNDDECTIWYPPRLFFSPLSSPLFPFLSTFTVTLFFLNRMSAAIAARLKLKRGADQVPPPPAPEPKRAASDGPNIRAGDTVLGNFKGLAETDEDWEEALVVGSNADGTFVLEYVDEGLVEEGVPSERIRPMHAAAASASDAPTYAAGATVLGNFKGLGDWDEALIIDAAADGTYTLEYVDEGLIEESVPVERIAPIDGGDAEASAAAASDGRFVARSPSPERMLKEKGQRAEDVVVDDDEEEDGEGEGEGEGDDDDDDDDDEDEGKATTADFIPCRAWKGVRAGYCFKASERGVGYHKDVPLHVAAEEAERAAIVLTAAQLANWTVEVLLMPPGVKKVDRFMQLYDLVSQ